MIGHWYDISLPLKSDLPTWPGSPGVLTTSRTSIKQGHAANVSHLSMDVHTGTHVDSPRHFIDQGATVEELGLDPFIGPATVVGTGAAKELDGAALEAAGVPNGAERVLLRTANSLEPTMYRTPFDQDYAALTLGGAEWLAAKSVRLVGIDYLSIQRYTAPADVHRVLLNAGIAILEGLRLHDVPTGDYGLVCLPLRLPDVEGSPARAILLPAGQVRRR
jgi:arylformamidase